MISASANVHTIKEHGPDRITGFSPIPAMSMLSYAAGSAHAAADGRHEPVVLRLVLRPAQRLARDLGRADRRQRKSPTGTTPSSSRSWAANLNMTRTPDVPLRRRGAPQRHEDGRVLTRLQPGRQVRRRMDLPQRGPGRRVVDGRQPRHPEGVPPREAKTPFFLDYTKKFTPTAPFLVRSRSTSSTDSRPASSCAPAPR